jgi:hypothetical protein
MDFLFCLILNRVFIIVNLIDGRQSRCYSFHIDVKKGGFMKRNLTVFAVLTVLLMVSCYSYPIKTSYFAGSQQVWDDELTVEDGIELIFFKGITVQSYNGIAVDWGAKPAIILPAGRAEFIINVDFYGDDGVSYKGNNLPFVWDFQKGDRYLIQCRAWGRVGLLLWDMNVKKKLEEQPFYAFPQGKTL